MSLTIIFSTTITSLILVTSVLCFGCGFVSRHLYVLPKLHLSDTNVDAPVIYEDISNVSESTARTAEIELNNNAAYINKQALRQP